MTRHENVINSILKKVNANYPNSEVYLYGSQARGDQDKNSDWDLLILLNLESVPFSLETQIMDDLYDLELEIDEVIAPLIYAKSDWTSRYSVTPIYENIQKEGIRIK